MTWLALIPGKIKAALGITLAVIVAIGIAFLRGRSAGIQHIEAEQTKRRLENMQTRAEIEDDVASMGSQDVDQNLARWNRDE